MSNTRSLKIKFEGGSGFLLDARLELPAGSPAKSPSGSPRAYAIFCHCFTCTKETLATFRISKLLARKGFAVLRFDFTGLGSSEGDFADTNFTTMVDDVIAASNYLRDNHQAPAFLFGHSMGGTAALAASLKLDAVKGIATIASPSSPDHVLHHFGEALALLEKNIAARFNIAGQSYPLKPQFVTDVRNYNTQELFSGITKPVLIFNVLHDRVVPGTNAQEISNWISGKSKIISVDKADHLLSDKDDARFVAGEIVEWMILMKNEK